VDNRVGQLLALDMVLQELEITPVIGGSGVSNALMPPANK